MQSLTASATAISEWYLVPFLGAVLYALGCVGAHGYITAEVGARPALSEHWGSEEHRQSRRGNARCYRAASNLWKLNMWGELSPETWAWALSQVMARKGKSGGSGGRGWECWNRAEWWTWMPGWMWELEWEFDKHGRGRSWRLPWGVRTLLRVSGKAPKTLSNGELWSDYQRGPWGRWVKTSNLHIVAGKNA